MFLQPAAADGAAADSALGLTVSSASSDGSSGTSTPGAAIARLTVATVADMRRFEAEGLSLVGAARLGEFEMRKPPINPDGGCVR